MLPEKLVETQFEILPQAKQQELIRGTFDVSPYACDVSVFLEKSGLSRNGT
jgi:hypothetical protein